MEEAKQDCIDWIMNFVEQPHEFYDFKFPPCPFAKKVRIDNDLIIESHHQGSLINFTKAQIDVWLESNKTVMVIFSDIKYDTWLNRYRLRLLNKFLVSNDRFLQFGVVKTNGKKYFAIFMNRLSLVLDGSNFLKNKKEYYKDWTESHYKTVVEYRDKVAKKYGNEFIRKKVDK